MKRTIWIFLFTLLFASAFSLYYNRNNLQNPSKTISSLENSTQDSRTQTASQVTTSHLQNSALSENPSSTTSSPSQQNDNFNFSTDEAGLSLSSITLKTERGSLKLKLYSKDAPQSSKAFYEMCKEKQLLSSKIIRADTGYLIQFSEINQYSKKIPLELNAKPHLRGTIGFSKGYSETERSHPQVYITLANQPALNQNYSVIGKIIEESEKGSNSKELLEKLTKGDTITDIVIDH
jgi:cyclophilin family peptidyl-prolyl cis-trans isomerase